MFGKDGLGRAPLLADLRRRQPPRLHEIFSLTLVGSDKFADRPEPPPKLNRIFLKRAMVPPIFERARRRPAPPRQIGPERR